MRRVPAFFSTCSLLTLLSLLCGCFGTASAPPRDRATPATDAKPPVTTPKPPPPHRTPQHPSAGTGGSTTNSGVEERPGPPRPQPHEHRVTTATSGHPTTSESEDAALWHQSLPSGLIDHTVQPQMELTKSYPVTVTIHGEAAPPSPTKPGTVTDKLQVSPRMVVELTEPDNPDGFKIDPADPQPPKLIASDGATTWIWTVTPKHLGDLKLHIAAYVLYEDDPNNRLSYATYDSPVTVHSVTVKHESKTAWEWVQENPGKTLTYLLPGGAGAAIIGKLFDLWRKRRKKGKPVEEDAEEGKESKSEN